MENVVNLLFKFDLVTFNVDKAWQLSGGIFGLQLGLIIVKELKTIIRAG